MGFAIINKVKDFLEAQSLEQFRPVRRLRAGPFQAARYAFALRTAILSVGIPVRIDGTFAGRVVTVMACDVSHTAANPTYRSTPQRHAMSATRIGRRCATFGD
jgi:hypothetical protein